MIITLLSDLGANNPYTPLAEAVLITRFPDARIVHISHSVTPFKVLENAYHLKCVSGLYPAGTIQVVLSDIFMSLPCQFMLCRHQEYTYIGIDNGILPAAFSVSHHHYYLFHKVSGSFPELLDHLCQVIHIAQNQKAEDSKVLLPYQPSRLYEFPPVINRGNSLECMVIFIDNYGNIITNLQKPEFEEIRNDRKYRISFLRDETIEEITDYFKSSESGGIVAYFNEFGYMQISMRSKNNNTASMLGLTVFHGESYINNYIKIEFAS